MNKRILFFLFFTISGALSAQSEQGPFEEKNSFTPKNKQKFFFKVQNQNIFKNNEYFNLIEPGYTLFGSQANFTLKYYPTSNTFIEGGIHLLYYYGREKLDRVLPIFRFQYTPVKGLQIIFGNIYGGMNHKYSEPLYRFERVIENPPEIGLQFIYQNKRIQSDLFINWQNYLLRNNYTDQEQFTLGYTGNFKILNPSHRLQLDIPLQFLSTHRGSQIDTLDLHVVTLMNIAVGSMLSYHFTGFIKEIGLSVNFMFYNDLSPVKEQAFTEGNGFFPEIFAKSKWINIHIGYWKARDFIAPLGEPLFSSISYMDEGTVFPDRQMLNIKIDLHHIIADGIFIGGRFESYYDILGNINKEKQPHNDFSYGVYINFNHDFFLKKVK